MACLFRKCRLSEHVWHSRRGLIIALHTKEIIHTIRPSTTMVGLSGHVNAADREGQIDKADHGHGQAP